MYLEHLHLKNFRNIEELSLNPGKNVNIIYGNNAQGKTNLLEAIWLLTGAKSFRAAKDNQLLKINTDHAELDASFYSQNRTQQINIKIIKNQKRKKVMLNLIEQESCSKLSGVFSAVVFSPSHLSLIKDGPAFRRKYIDLLLCQTSKIYLKNLIAYGRVIEQRNALLKQGENESTLALLSVWNQRVAEIGARIIYERIKLVERLSPLVSDIYSGISRKKETLRIKYSCSIKKDPPKDLDELIALFLQKLQDNKNSDFFTGVTQAGPHRDDLDIEIDDLDAKTYGSQGQQRSCVLSLKLAECTILEELLEEKPVVLLDDVLSELDYERQTFILNYVLDKQVFITCCDKSFFDYLKGGKVFHIEHGNIIKNEG